MISCDTTGEHAYCCSSPDDVVQRWLSSWHALEMQVQDMSVGVPHHSGEPAAGCTAPADVGKDMVIGVR
jgi:hypothetical protein